MNPRPIDGCSARPTKQMNSFSKRHRRLRAPVPPVDAPFHSAAPPPSPTPKTYDFRGTPGQPLQWLGWSAGVNSFVLFAFRVLSAPARLAAKVLSAPSLRDTPQEGNYEAVPFAGDSPLEGGTAFGGAGIVFIPLAPFPQFPGGWGRPDDILFAAAAFASSESGRTRAGGVVWFMITR